MGLFFNLEVAEKATSLTGKTKNYLIDILTELLKYTLNIRDAQSIQIIFKYHKLLKHSKPEVLQHEIKTVLNLILVKVRFSYWQVRFLRD